MALNKQTKKFSELLNKFLEDSKEHLKEIGFDQLTISEIHLEKPKNTPMNDIIESAHDENDDPIICKNIKKGNKVELVCKKASQWK